MSGRLLIVCGVVIIALSALLMFAATDFGKAEGAWAVTMYVGTIPTAMLGIFAIMRGIEVVWGMDQ